MKPIETTEPIQIPLHVYMSGLYAFSDCYPQLMVLLTYENKIKHADNDEFLLLTPTYYGRVKVASVEYVFPYVTVTFVKAFTGNVDIIQLDVNNLNKSIQFIPWYEIKYMVNEDIINCYKNSGLLELDESLLVEQKKDGQNMP